MICGVHPVMMLKEIRLSAKKQIIDNFQILAHIFIEIMTPNLCFKEILQAIAQMNKPGSVHLPWLFLVLT